MSSYIPPHLRNKKKVDEDVPKKDDFPSLSVSKPKSSFAPTRSFASLASEWSDNSEYQKQKELTRKEIENREMRRYQAEMRNVVKFNHNTYTENETYPEEIVKLQPSSSDDDWTTVTHTKLRKDLSSEEKLERELAREEEEKRMREESSMWNNSTQDDWDYRDRRTL